MNKYIRTISLLAVGVGILSSCSSKLYPSADPVSGLYSKAIVIPNITYLKVDSTELQLDAYIQAQNLGESPWVKYSDTRKPVLLYIHGGGWSSLTRSVRNLNIMPFVAKGWNVINIDYRLLGATHFPAPIADCRYALNWIYENASTYGFDTTRIVVSGESAGGHLSLMTGLLNSDEAIKLDGHPIARKLKVAAVINWYGVTDLKRFDVDWMTDAFTQRMVGDLSNREYIFKLCSPSTYVGESTPAVLTIHGDKDPVVPYSQATYLHGLLDKKGIKNQLYTVKGKKHGDFDEQEQAAIFNTIWKFLLEVTGR